MGKWGLLSFTNCYWFRNFGTYNCSEYDDASVLFTVLFSISTFTLCSLWNWASLVSKSRTVLVCLTGASLLCNFLKTIIYSIKQNSINHYYILTYSKQKWSKWLSWFCISVGRNSKTKIWIILSYRHAESNHEKNNYYYY
jgi:hypothetical protein